MILKNRIKKTYSKEETLKIYLEYACFFIVVPATNEIPETIAYDGERKKKRMPGGEGKKNISPYLLLPFPTICLLLLF